MKLGIFGIVGVLLGAMLLLCGFWEVMEGFVQDATTPGSLMVFNLVRLSTTSILMAMLTAWLMLSYSRQFHREINRHSEEAHRARGFADNIVRDAGEAIISLDTNGVIKTWNRAAERIYGYAADEIVGHRFTRLVPPRLIAEGEPEKILEAVREHGYVRNYETGRLRKDGAEITVRITRSVLRDADGGIIGWSAIVSDVTAEKELEARLIQAEKLAVIGGLAASTAHEVRNALAGIAGTIEVLKTSPTWLELPPDVRGEVGDQLARIARIADDLLAYARPSAPDRRRIDMNDLVDRAVAGLARSPEAALKETRISRSSDPIFAEIDPEQVEQAFHNLIENAYEAMAPGGRLEVSTKRATGVVEVRFADSGAGMGPEALSRAMDPFFTTKAKGSGLGLAIARAIVERHKGTLHLTSSPRSGTTAVVTFPAGEGMQEAA